MRRRTCLCAGTSRCWSCRRSRSSAREASDAGRARARKLARLLAQRGIAVASGLARGIDTAAHRGALDAGGITFAVIGTPLTRCYPSENAELQCRIGQVGAVVSQFAPSSKTRPSCFPMRNATMSGLTLGTVVIEASENSGSLIQARKALEQGRKLFIPRGSHRLGITSADLDLRVAVATDQSRVLVRVSFHRLVPIEDRAALG